MEAADEATCHKAPGLSEPKPTGAGPGREPVFQKVLSLQAVPPARRKPSSTLHFTGVDISVMLMRRNRLASLCQSQGAVLNPKAEAPTDVTVPQHANERLR